MTAEKEATQEYWGSQTNAGDVKFNPQTKPKNIQPLPKPKQPKKKL